MMSSPDTTGILGAAFQSVAETLPQSVAGDAIAARLRANCLLPRRDSAVSSGHLLLRTGFISHSETLFRSLAEAFPGNPAGMAGLAQAATQRKALTTALRRWDEVIAAFPQQDPTYWMASRARILYELGKHQDARAILHALDESRDQPHGSIGLAQLEMRQGRWNEALRQWDTILARHEKHDSRPFSRIGRATVLLNLGRHTEAEAELHAVLEADPWMVGAHVVLMSIQANTGRLDDAVRVPLLSIFTDAAVPILCHAKLGILLQWRLLGEARLEFLRYSRSAVEIESIRHLFEAVPLLYDGWQRIEVWLDLLRRLDDLQSQADADVCYLYWALRARIKLALRDYRGYRREIQRIDAGEHLGELEQGFKAVAAALDASRFPDYGRAKIFGIGLSKTGTTTLAAALTALGMSTLHWTNPLTCELVGDADLPFFDAHTDTPVCMAFEKYFYLFPAAKFIYTTRPLDSWLDSMRRHWQKALNIGEFAEFQRQVKLPGSFRFGSEFCAIHQTLYLNHADLRHAYEAHDRRVRSFFRDKPKDRLLVFNVFEGHGWQELCAFLGMSCPSVRFPFENRSQIT